MFQVKIASSDKTVIATLSEPELLSHLLFDQNVHLDMPCAGKGKCLKCRVRATGSLSELTEIERKALSEEERTGGLRLACMTYVTGDAEIHVNSDDKSSAILFGGHMPQFEKHPLCTQYGIAVDIGTTTVAAYLYDLNSCKRISHSCANNPQRAFGADVISRIEKSMAGNTEQLAQAIIECIERMAADMCAEQHISPENVDCLVITGNTTMLYLLTKTDVKCLAYAPFQATTLLGTYADQNLISLKSMPNAKIYLPDCISAYVGADITTAILSSEMTDSDVCSILVDIGTNGEMALQFSGKLWCCSTAAGPAFEGAGIHMGMNASKGAIDRVFVKDGAIRYTTIDHVPASGICGSGIVDAAAVLLSAGIIDETGRIEEKGHSYESCICEVDHAPAFRFENSEVVITQKDIREIQLAKSAICAGLQTLLNEAQLDPSAVQTFYIAGGFGSFIDIGSAVTIGLFPKVLKSKAVVLGNAAGMGACMILLSDEMLKKSTRIAQKAENIELSTSQYFMDTYIDGMMFE
jgi:uncharacterized 2Fe-2S/4Fe-4S cluster protein (DUF4445 family)